FVGSRLRQVDASSSLSIEPTREMLIILAGVATWEREIMLERLREGIARAKAADRRGAAVSGACAPRPVASPPGLGQPQQSGATVSSYINRGPKSWAGRA